MVRITHVKAPQPPPRFRLVLDLQRIDSCRSRVSVVAIPDDVMEGAAEIAPPDLRADTYAAAQAKMHAKVMRRILLARYALRAAEQLADQMDDADGWNDQPGAAEAER